MTKAKRARKLPLTTEKSKRMSTTHKATQATISSYHTLLKQQSRVKAQIANVSTSHDHEVLNASLARIDTDIAALGGLETYQNASKLGQSAERGGDSAKVLIDWLKELGKAPSKTEPILASRKTGTPIVR